MLELAKDEGKILDDDKYGNMFKEDSSDDDFNPDDVKKEVHSSSAEENEEGEEDESDEEEDEEEQENISYKSPKKKKKNEEEILDIDQLDIDKIDMIEDLRDRGLDIDISDEEYERLAPIQRQQALLDIRLYVIDRNSNGNERTVHVSFL